MLINVLCDISTIEFELNTFIALLDKFYNEVHPLMDNNYHRFYT